MTFSTRAAHPTRFTDDGLSGLVWGAPPAQAVLLHGALLNANAWDRVLTDAAYPAIAFDLPGHGRSSRWDAGDYTSERMAASFTDWWQSTDRVVSRSTLIGHSRGALVAVHLAARIPSRIARLVLVDADPTRPKPTQDRRRGMRHTGSFDELVDGAARMRPDLDRAQVAAGVERGAMDNGDGTWSWRWDERVPQVPIGGGLLDGDIDALGAVECPVTIVRGRESPAIDDAALERIRATLGRDVSVHTLPGGHNPHSEAPEKLAAVLDGVVCGRVG